MKRLFSLLIGLYLATTLTAQNSNFKQADDDYTAIVMQAGGGYPINFTALRLSYVNTSFYEPYLDIREEFKYLTNDEAKVRIGQLMWVGGLSLVDFSHIAVTVFDALNDDQGSKFFRYLGEQLLKSIYESGDGLSEASAWQVVNIREEYFLLNSLNYRVLGYRNYEKNGQFFDELRVESMSNGEQKLFYFNTTLMQPK